MTVQSPLTVFIVDDDDDRFFMEHTFKADSPDIRLYLAAGGPQAIDMLGLAFPPPDVIILDLNMPGLNGFAVLKYLKQSAHHRHIPVFILTTSDALKDKEEAQCLDADGFITKPTTQNGLVAIAEQIRHKWANHPS